MNILLDTNYLIWTSLNTLSPEVDKIITDRNNNIYFSPASIWEIVIKQDSNNEDFNVDATSLYNALLGSDIKEIAISSKHSVMVGNLPSYHNDPFDRILLSQAIVENMSFFTSDKKFKEYPYKNILYFKKA